MKHGFSRRTFLKAAISATALAGCSPQQNSQSTLPELTAAQLSKRLKGPSQVALLGCQSYEEDLLKLLKSQVGQLNLPDLKGKTVILKPNMVEYRPNNLVNTNPAVVAAAAHLVDYLGAREIIIAEGPGHYRDTDYLLAATGIGAICSRLGLRFVDLNLDDIEKVDNADGLAKTREFYLPRTILESDALISLPKLKTHHWVGITASMKNLFGTVPGCKYGWPKNFLHWQGISESIIDLVHLIQPAFAIVDAIEAMQADGPINGKAADMHFIAMGADLAAIDATCARTMSVEPQQLKYLKLAGAVVGNIESKDITVLGTSLDSLRQKVKMPITFSDPSLLKGATSGGS